MSNIIKSESGKVTNRRKPKNETQQRNAQTIDAQPANTQSVDAVGSGDLVRDAVVLADSEYVTAIQAYDVRRAENTERFFAHVRNRQSQTSQAVTSHIQEAYGLTLADIYGEDNAAQIEAE